MWLGDARDAIESLVSAHPRSKTENGSFEYYRYGTSGFRCAANILDSTLLRSGMVAAVRSAHKKGRVVGAVITASHNPAKDNGVKLVDPSGSMMNPQWEGFAAKIANTAEEKTFDAIVELASENDLTPAVYADVKPRVFLARDTRPSSEHLAQLFIKGAEALGAEVTDFGQLTTPQLHYLVRLENVKQRHNPTVDDYNNDLSTAFFASLETACEALGVSLKKPLQEITVDCSSGVGHVGVEKITSLIKDTLPIRLINLVNQRSVNDGCGSEHVQTTRTFPSSVSGTDPEDAGRRFASFDGDADRIVFFFQKETPNSDERKCGVLDGDKIITLYTIFLKRLLAKAGIEDSVNLGVVQTAYANGASTKYMQEELQVPVEFSKTGVKNMHVKADKFDVGVYFEANGHGTVVFSKKLLETVEKRKDENKAFECLHHLSTLINQVVGDAISDLLFGVVCLTALDWTLEDWNRVYTELPFRNTKLVVVDRTVIQTTEDDKRVTTPSALQDDIDEVMKQFNLGRSFVRPSGTEDIVRVYAEAHNDDDAAKLSDLVRAAVVKHLK